MSIAENLVLAANLILRLSEEIIQRERLTTLMVTHSMQQAVNREIAS
jgi:ABC-type uncharacterized transport system ATPase component